MHRGYEASCRRDRFIGNRSMMFFKKKSKNHSYDKECKKPVIKASICNGEQVVGFKDLKTGAFEEISLIKTDKDLYDFKKMYGITGDIEKVY